MIQVFLSHSARDATLAEAVADFLRTALHLPARDIRCTSVPGYKLPGGAHTEAQLRREVREAGVLVGLLSAASLESLYVAFELGARWGDEKPLVPLFAPGFDVGSLRGPLSSINGLRSDSRDDLHQLVRDLAAHLGRTPEAPDAYGRALEAVLACAEPDVDLVAVFDEAIGPPVPIPAPADDYANADRVVREHCEAEHQDDYSMLDFCMNQQRRAVDELRQGAPPGVPPDVFGKIRARAARDYPTDFSMRRFTEKQETDAYRRTRPDR